MSNKAGIIFAFILGAGVGAIGMYWHIKEEYSRIAQEEIDSVKEVFAKRYAEETEEKEAASESNMEKPSIKEYAARLQKEGYTNYSEPEEEVMEENKPYVISPEEFGEHEGYDQISLTYYLDGVLTDEYDDEIEDVDDVVGRESLSHFGEYENDSVFVRNDERKVDYEILLDQRNYSDVTKHRPPQMEV